MTDAQERAPKGLAALRAENLALQRRVDALQAECRQLTDEARRPPAADAEAGRLRGEIERLQAIDARNRLIAETIDDVVWILDLNFHYVYVSPSVRKFRGYTPEEAQALSLEESLTEDSYTRAREVLREEMAREAKGSASDRSRSLELAFRAKDGRTVWGEARMIFVRDDDGRPTGILGTTRDITERRELERQLRDSEAGYRLLADNASDMISRHDVEGRYTYVSPACRWLLGYESEELLGRSAYELFHPDDLQAIRNSHESIVATPDVATVAYRILRKDGAYTWFETTSRTIRDAGTGEAKEIIATSRDVSARKAVEEELRQANERLEHALDRLGRMPEMIRQERLDTLGQMASGVAHDFNNALTPVTGFSELLLTRPHILDDRDRTTSYLRLMNTAAQDGAAVVRRLRSFYVQTAGETEFQALELRTIIEEAASLTEPRWKGQASATGAAIEIKVDCAASHKILGSAADLREAFTNLIFNAVDAMPQGGVLTLSCRDEADRVVAEVTDSGAGMSEAVRQRCFEPFYSTKGEEGSGLGLPMVRGIVHRHRGEIEVSSAPGEGTVFTLRFPPLWEEPVSPEPATPSAARDRAGVLRVLVVDDDERSRFVITELVVALGHNAESVGNGESALERLARGEVDVVVSDLAMPEMTGDQLAATIRARWPSVRVVLATGFGSFTEEMLGGATRADLVLAKPVRLEELRMALVGREW